MSFLSNAKRGRLSGFTLIELLVVIAIIGVLASIVLASLNNARIKSRDARRITDIRQIQLALELYYDGAGNGEYPDEGASNTVPSALQTSGYIPQIPVDPSTGAGYSYVNLTNSSGTACAVASGTCTFYQLGAVLEVSGNPALTGDADKDLSGAGGLDGNDANCDSTAGAGADQCYDVNP